MSYKRKEVIGDCVLYLGDCQELAPLLYWIDTVFTSPPYNCGKDYGSSSDSLTESDYKAFLKKSLSVDARVKIINVGQYQGSRQSRKSLPAMICDAVQSFPVEEVLWDKGPANGAAWGNYPNSPRIRAQHESLLVFGDLTMPNGNGLDWSEWSRLTTSIWRVQPNVDLSVHPAMMPTELARRAVALWSDTEGTVYDPFMGSGTTGVACVELGRKFIGVELDESHFETACKRIEEAHKQPSLFPVEKPKPPKNRDMFEEDAA